MSEDGGVSWRAGGSGSTCAQVHKVTVGVRDPSRLFTAGRTGLLKSPDGGEHWEGLNYPPASFQEASSVSLGPSNSENVLASADGMATVYRSRDGGRTWEISYDDPRIDTSAGVRAGHSFKTLRFAPSDSNVVYAGACVSASAQGSGYMGPSFGIFKSTNGGGSFAEANDERSSHLCINDLAVSLLDSDIVYAASQSAGILRSSNGGRMWSPANAGLPILDVRVLAIDPRNPATLYAGLENGGVYKSLHAAVSWQATGYGMNPRGSVRDIVIDPFDPKVLFASVFQDGVYRSEDGGKTWTAVNRGLPPYTVSSLALSSDGGTLYAATEGEGVFRLDARPQVDSLSIPLPPGGAGATATIGGLGSVQAGYATAGISSGDAPYGTAVFSFKQNGVTVSEAGVPASPPTTSARIFIDYRSAVPAVPGRIEAGAVDINTGIAVVNRGSATANVTYVLRNILGAALSSGNGTIAAGAHFAKFIDQLKEVASDFRPPSDFQSTIQFGSLEISSDQPLSIVALGMTTNQRNEVLFTTTPTPDLTQSLTSTPTYFPQFADGGGYTTALVLLNTSNGTETGTFQILDDMGAPLVVNQIGGTADSSFKYSIPSGGAFRFQTDGFPATTKVGWVQLTPDAGTSTPVGAGIFGYTSGNVLVTESGIPVAASTTHARVYVDLSAGHNTGLAIANPAESSANISIKAFQSDGTTGIGVSQGLLLLPVKGHGAKFAGEFVTGLPQGFTGVLDIRSATPFAALTMRSLTNERGDFLLTTFPIADVNRAAPSPIVFPQIADGGGYVTQFILLSPGGASSARLNFYDESGAVGRRPVLFCRGQCRRDPRSAPP